MGISRIGRAIGEVPGGENPRFKRLRNCVVLPSELFHVMVYSRADKLSEEETFLGTIMCRSRRDNQGRKEAVSALIEQTARLADAVEAALADLSPKPAPRALGELDLRTRIRQMEVWHQVVPLDERGDAPRGDGAVRAAGVPALSLAFQPQLSDHPVVQSSPRPASAPQLYAGQDAASAKSRQGEEEGGPHEPGAVLRFRAESSLPLG